MNLGGKGGFLELMVYASPIVNLGYAAVKLDEAIFLPILIF